MSYLEQTSAVEIKDSRISFFQSGKGTPILFLHGNPGSKQDFSAICSEVADDEFSCFSIDRPGHMNSEELLTNDDTSKWIDTEVFAEFIENKCNSKVTLVGYSLGAFLALKTAIKYPEMVSNIVLIAPFVEPDNKNEKTSSLPNLARNAFIGTLMGVVLPSLAQNKMMKHFENVFYPQKAPDEYVNKYLPRYTRFEEIIATVTDKNTMIETKAEVYEKMSDIKSDVTVVSGVEDRVCSPKKQIELLKSKLSNLKVVEIEGAGHALPFTHQKEIAKIIKEVVKAQ